MSESQTPKPRRRRGTRGRNRNPRPPLTLPKIRKPKAICEREGCQSPRARGEGKRYCTPLCMQVDTELARTQRVCQAVGAPDLWAAAVALSDALTEYRTHRASVRTAAQAVGITPAQYRALEQGTPHRQTPTGDTPAPAH